MPVNPSRLPVFSYLFLFTVSRLTLLLLLVLVLPVVVVVLVVVVVIVGGGGGGGVLVTPRVAAASTRGWWVVVASFMVTLNTGLYSAHLAQLPSASVPSRISIETPLRRSIWSLIFENTWRCYRGGRKVSSRVSFLASVYLQVSTLSHPSVCLKDRKNRS